jgi:hypothetical protein
MAVRGTLFRFGGDIKGTARIALLEGDVSINTPKETLRLTNNYGTVVPMNQLPIPPIKLLPPPKLEKYPINQLTTSIQVLEFSWIPVKIEVKDKTKQGIMQGERNAVLYHFELADDEHFNSIVEEQFVAENYLKTMLLHPGSYYWRISSIDDNGLEGSCTQTSKVMIIRKQDIVISPEYDPIIRDGHWIIGANWAISFMSSTEDHSIRFYEYSLNNVPFASVEDRVFFRDDGMYNLQVRGVGEDGHRGDTFTQLIEVDAIPPEIKSFVGPVTVDADSNQSVSVIIDVFDKTGVRKTYYQINDGPQLIYTGNIKLNLGKKIDHQPKSKNVSPQNFIIIIDAYDLMNNQAHEVIDLSYE